MQTLMRSAGDMLGGEGVTFVTGQQHEALRQLMAPYFTQEAVNQMLPDIQDKARQYLQTWQDQGEGLGTARQGSSSP